MDNSQSILFGVVETTRVFIHWVGDLAKIKNKGQIDERSKSVVKARQFIYIC